MVRNRLLRSRYFGCVVGNHRKSGSKKVGPLRRCDVARRIVPRICGVVPSKEVSKRNGDWCRHLQSVVHAVGATSPVAYRSGRRCGVRTLANATNCFEKVWILLRVMGRAGF
jgi:hypothetical protein